MTRSDRIFGGSKTAAQLRREATIAEGMDALGKALEREIRRQDRIEKKGKPALPAGGRKRGVNP